MASCGLPGSSGGPPSNAPCMTLLRVGFAEPPGSPRALVVSYTTVSPLPSAEAPGGLLSVALSRGSPRVGVTHHLALWSPDFPRRNLDGSDAAARPARPPPILRVSRRYSGAPSTASSAAPMMPASLRSSAGTIGVCRSSSGRNLSAFLLTPPPTTNSSGDIMNSRCP
jgi:hypothetical protein